MSRIHKLVAAKGTALLLAAAAATPAAAAPQPRTSIAALGDSYAAGYGIALPSAQNPCAQSAKAYPLKLSPGRADVEFLACSGATTMSNTDMPINTVLAQLEGISPDAQIVTLTVGGNDIGFASLALACAGGFATETCLAAQTAAQAGQAALPVNLVTVLTALRAQAPNAHIYVTGYPLLFQPELTLSGYSCPVLPYDPNALATADQITGTLNGVIAGVVTGLDQTGSVIEYVDVTGDDAFGGHGLCDGAGSYIFAPTFDPVSTMPLPSSLHPTPAGHLAYAEAIVDAGFLNTALAG